MKKETRYCRWCGKHRTKFSGYEKMSIMSGNWSEMCSHCERKTNRIMMTNPFAGIFGDTVRKIPSETTIEVK